ncbi:hypothetical protein C0Q70_02296 [Pomacea canaliculata]|uniref:Glycosyltransferase family 92 protein n=1 Tax=Pomacea canaliculata TaxID=400727 RepID=A0A2T7PPI5_POMCA|nr:hypothetical protein C0Q70_02296 [Pomacea canaliculata]
MSTQERGQLEAQASPSNGGEDGDEAVAGCDVSEGQEVSRSTRNRMEVGRYLCESACEDFVDNKGEETWRCGYRSAAVICPLEAGDRPQAVSVVPPTWRESQGQQPLNVVHVHWRTYSSNLLRNLTRCNPALHSSLTASTPLVEMFTFNRHFGVGDQEQRVLDLYRSRGQLDLYQWNLPVPASDIHYFGQLANIQDCIYRNLHVSRYRMNTFLKTQAMATGTSRQKMIIDPTRVEISGIHDIEVFRPGFTRCRVQHSEGVLQHYRTVTEESEVNHLKRNHLPVDTFLHRYTDVIVTVASELTTLGMHDGIRLQQAVVPNPTKSQCNSIDDPINRSLRQRPGGALGGRHVTRVIGA